MIGEKEVVAKIAAARADRQRHAVWIDPIMKLAMPTYRRIGSKTTDSASQASEQDDLFDTTLQMVVEDFASDSINDFTPQHARWVKFEPAEDLSEGAQKEVADQLGMVGDAIFAEITRSNYFEAAQECFPFWAIAAMGMAVSDMGPLEPLHFQPIEIADLLLERGADGSVVGKWREMSMTHLERHAMWPAIFPAPTADQAKAGKKAVVIEGCDRDFEVPGVERWNYRILVDGKQAHASTYEGAGSCPLITCRYRHQADSAWGPGPTHKALPPARTLDELAYLNLKALTRAVDPPGSYEEDGVMNIEGGMEPGTWYPRAQGSGKPEALLPEYRFDALVFNREEMKREIKAAVYQDRPEQPGQTPPTATQWVDEKTWNTRRKELPRARCVREWVLPIIERVAWVLARRGALPEVKLQGGKIISVRPVSPLSKAKDLEDMQITNQVIGMATTIGTASQAGVPIDLKATMVKLQKTAGERHIVWKSDEQIQAEQAAMAAEQAGAQQGGAGVPAAA